MTLLDRHAAFVNALRDAGLPVSLSEGLDAVRALTVVELADREGVRAAYAATLVKRPTHRPVFDTLFDLWFPAVLGDGQGAGDQAAGEEDAPPPPAPDQASLPPGLRRDPLADALRERLRDALATGDDAELARIAREAVAAFGRGRAGFGGRTWSAHGALAALDPRTLMAALLRQVLAGAERGGMAERTARAMLERRIQRLQELVTADVRRRLAEERGAERVARTATRPPIERVDILRATRSEIAALRREVAPLARRLAVKLVAKQRRGRRGRLDFRRTVRASLSTGGVPLTTHHRPPRPHRAELVVLCDVSESVSSFAHFTLLLTYALREQFTKVRAFAFIDTVDEVTRFFAPGLDVTEAMARLTAEADLVWLSGHSDYGHAFERFEEKYGDVVGPRTCLLVLGDARNNYGDPGAEVLKRLVGRARQAYWLNPERRWDWDTGDSAAGVYGEILPMVECRNLEQLGQFVEELA